jgi:hypothetical protein
MGNVAALDEVALAGSGNMTHYIPTMGDVVGTLTKALSTITGMITCNYAIPAGSDPRLVNVEITVGAGMSTKIGGSPTRPRARWRLGCDNPAMPTMIISVRNRAIRLGPRRMAGAGPLRLSVDRPSVTPGPVECQKPRGGAGVVPGRRFA